MNQKTINTNEKHYIIMLLLMNTAIDMKKINGFDASEVISCYINIPLKEILNDLINIRKKGGIE